jgi:hypothetical protein
MTDGAVNDVESVLKYRPTTQSYQLESRNARAWLMTGQPDFQLVKIIIYFNCSPQR